MKKFSLLIFAILFTGCATVQVPTYLPDKNPYSKRYYATFDQAMDGVKQALEDFKWEIENTADPAVYEETRSSVNGEKQVMVYTKVRATPAFIGTRYGRMNIFITTTKDISEVEIRYLTITSTLFKTFQSYRNNAAADRFLKHLSELLQSE